MTDVERCDREIAWYRAQILAAAEPDMEGLLAGLSDWQAERRILLDEMTETH